MNAQAEPKTLHLLLPGLFGPQSGPWPEPGMSQGLDLPYLQKVLARSDRLTVAGDDFISTLLALFGLPAEDPPIGALCRLGDGGQADQECWLRADPVCYRADRDRLLLFEGRHLEILPQEAEEYAKLFNEHFSEDGWQLEPLQSDRWYLRVPERPDIDLPYLSDVSGRSIDPFLPRHDDDAQFYQRLNEIQMLFHHANPTLQRSARGQAAVNGLWLWGAGRLSEIPCSQFQKLISDEPLSKGLAKLALIPSQSTEGCEEMLPSGGAVLWVDKTLHRSLLTDDGMLWRQALVELNRKMAFYLNALKQKRLSALMLYSADGSCFCLQNTSLRRFWRRNHAFSDWIEE